MLSIFIPAFNAEKFLADTIDSLLSQRLSEYEIVICDDGSTDGTARIASAYSDLNPHIRYIQQSRMGAAAARNAAFSISLGRWVIYFDADDLIKPGSLAAMMQKAQLYPEEIVFCRWSKFIGNPAVLTRGPMLFTSDLPGDLWLERVFCRDYPTYPGCFILPRRLVERYGGWNEELSFQDDMEFYARIVSRTRTMRYCGEALFFCYRDGVPGSLSKTSGRRSSKSQWQATNLAVQHLLNASNTSSARSAGARQLMLVSYAQFLAALDISKKAEALAQKLASQLALASLDTQASTTMRRVLQIITWMAGFAVKSHALIRGFIS